MSKRRPTEASWESDEDLLGETSSVSAFSSRMQGDGLLDDQIDEDALLELDTEDKNQNYSFDNQNDIVERIDLGLSSDNCGFDDTANSQELDYEDVLEDPQLEETDDPLLVGEQPNETICTAQPTQPIALSQEDEEESDDENSKKDRGRFHTERNTISLSSAHTKSTDIPDSLEITKEMQEEIDSFEKHKGHGKFDRKRLGLRTRGQQQQQFRQPMSRGILRQRGPNMGQRGGLMSAGRFPGPRGTNPMTMRGPQNFNRPQRQPQGQFQQGFNPRPGVSNGRPRFPMEQQQGMQPGLTGPPPLIPQPLLSSPQQPKPFYQDQPHFIQTQPNQPQYVQPHNEPQFQQPQHSQPQPLIPVSQGAGSTIHVNPNFQGPLPADIRPQHQVVSHSVPQPLFSQPQSSFQNASAGWVQHTPPSAPAHVSYASSPQLHQPIQTQHQQPHMTPQPHIPALLGTAPHGIAQNRPPHQGGPLLNPQQSFSQRNPRQPFQQFQPRPQEASVRPISQRLGTRTNTHQAPHSAPQQVRQQRPLATQNVRGPRPANQVQGNLTQMRPNFRPRTPQMSQQRFQTPQGPLVKEPVQGWNPKPTQLVAPVKPVEKLDPEKEKKMKELEELKRKRAERFKVNAPVKIEEGNTSSKKIILRKAEKRPSGDDIKSEDISPIKTIKIEKGLEIKAEDSTKPYGDSLVLPVKTVKIEKGMDMKTEDATKQSGDAPEEMDHDTALKKALEEQKRHRELVMKAKEAKRKASADIRRRNLALKLAKEGKTLADVVAPVEKIETANISSQPQGQQQGQVQMYAQGHTQYEPFQQQNVQHQQFNNQIGVRGTNRGHMSNRGNSVNRGQGIKNQGQPISVLGRTQQTVALGQVGRGQGHVRGHGTGRGRGRGIQKQSSTSQLQQVPIQENIDYESYDSQLSSQGPVNRTVLPASTGPRQIIGMNNMGAASQNVTDRKVLETIGATSPQRRIVVDSKQSSTVLIKDLPPQVDLGKISKRCSEFGKTKVFNYKADEKSIVVQFSSPAEAAGFLQKSYRFMLDMNYYTAVSIPDSSV